MYSGYRRPQYSRIPYQQSLQTPQPSQDQRNLGRDIHSFMDGLNRIVQILYSSIPVLEFLRFVAKYCWKFCGFLGGSTLDLLAVSNLLPWYINNASSHDKLLESMWSQPSKLKIAMKALYLLGGLILLYTVYRRRNSLTEAWDEASSASDYEETDEEPEAVAEAEMQEIEEIKRISGMDRKSEEDIACNPGMYYPGAYNTSEYEEYPVMF
jgi:hypothetical protein